MKIERGIVSFITLTSQNFMKIKRVKWIETNTNWWMDGRQVRQTGLAFLSQPRPPACGSRQPEYTKHTLVLTTDSRQDKKTTPLSPTTLTTDKKENDWLKIVDKIPRQTDLSRFI